MTNCNQKASFLFLLLFNVSLHSFPLECSMNEGKETCRVSIIQLIAAPEKYHGKHVSVSGFYVNGLEMSAIFLSKQDADIPIPSNAIWINYIGTSEPECLEQKEYTWLCDKLTNYENASGKFVDVYGLYNMNNTGHLGFYRGAIENVKHFTLLQEN